MGVNETSESTCGERNGLTRRNNQRGITEEDSKKLEESKKPLEYGTQETTDTFKKVTPGEGAPQRFTQRIRESILRSRRRR